MWFQGKKQKQQEDDKSYQMIDQKHINYASVRDNTNYTERIAGRDGIINVLENEIVIVFADNSTLRCKKQGASVANFLSNNGAIIKSVDMKTGEDITILVYYTYFS